LDLIPKVVNQLSLNRSRVFTDVPLFNNDDSWIKAQDLQKHITRCGRSSKFVFTNYRFFEQKLETINKDLIKSHAEAFKSKTFQEYLKKRVLYIYDESIEKCECRNFSHFGYCKHYLAVKIYLGKLEVNFINY